MSLLVVGLSHRSAQMSLLERASLTADGASTLGAELPQANNVAEAVVLSTCNRLEVYADVTTFHGGLGDIGHNLAVRTGLPLEELTPHLYAHFGKDAVQHLFTVAAGLDSMAVGEGQILGQMRTLLRENQEKGRLGRALDPLLQHSLRVGKRVHSETGLDAAGPSMVSAALTHAATYVGGLEQAHVLVIGAGSMSSLSAYTAQRLGVRRITVANRTVEKAHHLATSVGGNAFHLEDTDELRRQVSDADIVISCTGALGYVLDADTVAQTRATGSDRPQVLVDLALPRDIDPAAARIPGVTVISLDELGTWLRDESATVEVGAAQAIVQQEVDAWTQAMSQAAVTPTVVALRSYADQVVAAEMQRLAKRLGDRLDPSVDAEVRQSVRRVAEKLIHNPTVRVKSLSASGAGQYAEALRELFGLEVDLQADGSVDEALRKVPPSRTVAVEGIESGQAGEAPRA